MHTGSMSWSPRSVVSVMVALLIGTAVAVAPEARAADFATAPGTDRIVTTPSPTVAPRKTTVYRPPTAGQNAPLVVMLHGKGGTGVTLRDPITDMDTIADREGFVVAYPEADRKFWNAGSACCRTASMPPVDDVGFLNTLVDQLIAEDGIDPDRVYAVGLSAGGVLAYKWACERGERLAGIAPVVGALQNPCSSPPAMTVVAVHGEKDKTYPVRGGTDSRGNVIPSLDQAIAPFLSADGCGGTTTGEQLGRLAVTRWEQCSGADAVVRAISLGEGHTWPGYRKKNPAPLPSYPYLGVDTSDFIWTNLERYTSAS